MRIVFGMVVLAAMLGMPAWNASARDLEEVSAAFDQAALRVDRRPATELARWTRPARLSIDPRFGAAARRDVLAAALSLSAEAGVAVVVDESGRDGGDELVVRPGGSCFTALEWDSAGTMLRAVVTLAIPSVAAQSRCIDHELLHALGLRGHPKTPDSVLSAHPLAARAATSLDRLMLRALYDRRLAPAMTMMEVSRASRAVLADLMSGGRIAR